MPDRDKRLHRDKVTFKCIICGEYFPPVDLTEGRCFVCYALTLPKNKKAVFVTLPANNRK